MEKITGSQIVLHTLRSLKDIRHDFEILYESTVKNTMHYLESIQDGIFVRLKLHTYTGCT